MKYSVDRIEEKTAVLIDENRNVTTVPIILLPDAIKPGSMLKKSGECFVLDEKETNRRKKHLHDLQKELFSDKNFK